MRAKPSLTSGAYDENCLYTDNMDSDEKSEVKENIQYANQKYKNYIAYVNKHFA